MKRIVPALRAHSPVVKKSSYLAEKNHSLSLQDDIGKLYWQIAQMQKYFESMELQKDMALEAMQMQMVRGQEYNKWVAMHYPKTTDIANQRLVSTEYEYRPKISIVLPVYDTKPSFLDACIMSVKEQSYVNWELCIVDDASSKKATLQVLKKYESGDDPRIKIQRSSKNGHISVASNLAIDMAEGEFIALLDHDDVLWPNALFEMVRMLQIHPDANLIYSDEDKIDQDGFMHRDPYFKPDWSPHLLECINYITHFTIIRKTTLKEAGGFLSNMVGAQDWDLFLRISENTTNIYHVPSVLYSWRIHPGSTSSSMESKGYATVNQRLAIESHLERSKPEYKKEVLQGHHGYWYARYRVVGRPLVSIIIPSKDKKDYLSRCITSILNKTDYSHYEIIIVDTGSKEESTKSYYANLKAKYSNKKIRIKRFPKQPFNYSDACNFGAKAAKGQYLVMLNNDTELLSEMWLTDMLGYAQQPDIAAVGVKLLYPTGKLQHAGVTLGLGSWEPVAAHIGQNMPDNSPDFLQALYTNTVRDVSAVTAACLMVSTDKFWKVNGFNPAYRVTFNDVDLCLQFRKAGFHNIYLPFVELVHDESISVGRVLQDRDMGELNKSAKLMRLQWKDVIDKDPYYNPNFYILSSNFGLDVYPSQD
jgi:glycosyltransferase involved in cell wall biosynthesis